MNYYAEQIADARREARLLEERRQNCATLADSWLTAKSLGYVYPVTQPENRHKDYPNGGPLEGQEATAWDCTFVYSDGTVLTRAQLMAKCDADLRAFTNWK